MNGTDILAIYREARTHRVTSDTVIDGVLSEIICSDPSAVFTWDSLPDAGESVYLLDASDYPAIVARCESPHIVVTLDGGNFTHWSSFDTAEAASAAYHELIEPWHGITVNHSGLVWQSDDEAVNVAISRVSSFDRATFDVTVIVNGNALPSSEPISLGICPNDRLDRLRKAFGAFASFLGAWNESRSYGTCESENWQLFPDEYLPVLEYVDELEYAGTIAEAAILD